MHTRAPRLALALSAAVFTAAAWTGCFEAHSDHSGGVPASAVPTSDVGLAGANAVRLVDAFPGAMFSRPVDFLVNRAWPESAFVAEQEGRVLRVAPEGDRFVAKPVLDIRDRVRRRGNEEGLLGIDFHPDADRQRLFVYYSASSPRRSVVSYFEVDAEGGVDPSTEVVILEVEQPYSNHNGGQIRFGPDGYLYIGLGDGGSGGDPLGSGQDTGTLLGAILRIDVDGEPAYSIPPDNPFVGASDARAEIYAYGLRNPWRFDFDPEDGTLWAADVGQDNIEEVDIIEAGGNYGWKLREGTRCFSPSSDCPSEGLIPPVWQYDRAGGTSITGGIVYRGAALPALVGSYLTIDYKSGKMWAVRPEGSATRMADTDLNVSAFGRGLDGEAYLCAFDGRVYRLAPVAAG